MAVCSNCGVELEEGQKFCFECGTPVPQSKKCIKCGAELALKMKFCPECGTKQDGEPKAVNSDGLNMGNENVIAGDVIGHKEETHVAGNATIIKNEDQTKQVKKCHVCGSIVPITQGFECPECGQFTCDDCYDEKHGVCTSCAEKKSKDSVDQYKNALKEVLADGRIELSERKQLNALQQKFGIPSEVARKLENEMKNAGAEEKSLTIFEDRIYNEANTCFYDDGNVKKALELLEPVYQKHKHDEKILDLYLPALAEVDSEKALEITGSLEIDVLSAYITEISLAVRNRDFDKAELKIKQAMRMWQGNALANSWRVAFYYAMYKHFSDKSFFDKAKEIAETLDETQNELELSYAVKMKAVLAEEAGEPKLDFNKEFCKENNLFWHIMCVNPIRMMNLEECTVGKDKDCDFSSVQEGLDSVMEGGTVHVKPGIYKEHLVFEKSLKLIGCADSVKDKASKDLPIIVLDSEKFCDLKVPVEIEGLCFTNDEEIDFSDMGDYEFDDADGGDYDEDYSLCCLRVESDSVLKNIAVLGSASHGIIFASGKAKAMNLFISQNDTDGIVCVNDAEPEISNCEISHCYAGIDVVDKSSPVLTECLIKSRLCISENSKPRISNCEISEEYYDGIYITGNSEPTIEKCKIHNAGGVGISINLEAKPQITNCKIFKNDEEGIYISDSSAPRIENCEIYDNKRNGIWIRNKAAPKIMNCKIHDNKTKEKNYPGVIVDDDSKPQITKCEIYNHLSCGIWVRKNATGIYDGCKIHDNEETNDKSWYDSELSIRDNAKPIIKNCEIYNAWWNGICIRNNAAPKIENCKIHDGKVEGDGNGISINDDSNPQIIKCEIYNFDGCGIRSEWWGKNSSKLICEGCKIHSCGTGLELAGTIKSCEIFKNNTGIIMYEGRIENCKIYNNSSGIDKLNYKTIIKNSEIFNNSSSGIYINDRGLKKELNAEPEVYIETCKLYNNESGIWIENCKEFSIENCEIYDNKKKAIDNKTSIFIDTSSCEIWNNGEN
ncbi:right-handed parallel beta-helix repeat-containing protein [uncultured Treponema sp.]|uniref:right-handed parallel beta-helix repeat-containing protein n=1 Tax=uncultured Treponema sp. TaxID=162155 RepID=UPI0025CD1F8F|nr:right-handed parallel beta-helix repeat-containing protein [uncultured Treponema sp.]